MQTQLEAQNAQLQQEIEERRQAEARLAERTAQLLAANQELEAFSYSVSHDLRAPLRSIASFAGILSDSHAKALSVEGRQCLDKIIAAATRMSQLIEDLLQYARTGRAAIRRVPISLLPLTQSLLATFAERAARDHIRLEVVEPLATPLGDSTLLGQVLNNLVDNAMTYRRREGTPEVRVSSERVGDQVVLRVVDNGIGIAPEFHEKIFQVFQRLHSNDEYPGTGIGLATVAKAVRLMDGRISLDSTPGRGSTFSIHLPAAS
jgi:signal transduction histidine kinase